MKSVYTYEMFVEDSVVFDRQYEDIKHVLVPKAEWPIAKLSDLTYPVDQNLMETRLVNFMREK